jgi:hypothetical protein
VSGFLQESARLLTLLQYQRALLDGRYLDDHLHETFAEQERHSINKAFDFFDELSSLATPYMRMHYEGRAYTRGVPARDEQTSP